MTSRVLILEDDLETLSAIAIALFELEEKLFDQHVDFAVTVFSEYTEVENYLNKIQEPNFDIILLDRDCKLGGSFHAINVQKFGADKFIAISSQPEHNEAARKMGIRKIIQKDYKNLDDFGSRLIEEVFKMVRD